ncbi:MULTISPECIES: exosortase family protein XrtF [unclassified Flavobacterium]|uniref:exosortase family protein XrtF n=1 Tax=unclassified Flavobacterium TaxID=196869 RepID=UPI003F93568D
MREYLFLYKPFLLFLSKFFLTYIVLTLFYQLYLDGFSENAVDGITQAVSKNTALLLNTISNGANIEKKELEPYIILIYKQRYIARVIEGCNAISVIILFIAFIVAFSGKLKTTLLFIFGGSLVIYILNVFRIALLVILLYKYPNQSHILHDALFPLFIYGVVFLLWIIWINKFSSYAKKAVQT